jgi:hypothetical protein
VIEEAEAALEPDLDRLVAETEPGFIEVVRALSAASAPPNTSREQRRRQRQMARQPQH